MDGLRKVEPLFILIRFLKRSGQQWLVSLLRHLPKSWVQLGSPKGIYSELDLLRSGQVEGFILLEKQNTIRAKPDSLRITARLGQEGYQPWPIFWTKHPRARLAGSTLVLMDEHKFAASEAMYGTHAVGDPAYNAVWLPSAIYLPGNWTSVISLWCCRETSFNYYHWLMDGLPRLAALGSFPNDTHILIPHSFPAYGWDSLKALGLQDRLRETHEKHLVLENYYFSSPTAMTGCANPYATDFLRKSFLGLADKDYSGPERFYIRRKGKTRGIWEEDKLIEILLKRNWGVVDLEELTFAQQIKLFADAKAICGVHGAGFTNLVWCQPGCVVMEFFASNFLNGCYESIASCVGVDYRFRVFTADANFHIQIEPMEFEKLLLEISP